VPTNIDPIIVQLLSDPTKRTSFIVEIEAPTPRRWTPFPRGLVIGGARYLPQDVTVSGVVEVLDQTQPVAASVTIANANNVAGDLVRDAANRRKPVTIRRVWFDDRWTVAATEVWFSGVTGKPSLRGQLVTLQCNQNVGRRGSSPTRAYAELMHSHRPPENLKVTVSGG
jgi:hypothetical protein